MKTPGQFWFTYFVIAHKEITKGANFVNSSVDTLLLFTSICYTLTGTYLLIHVYVKIGDRSWNAYNSF